MPLLDAMTYEGKRAFVVGGATGMGAAVAELARDAGGDIVVADRAEVTLDGVTPMALDLSDRASIDAAVESLGGPIDVLFSCAGVADGTPGIERINFIGHRYLIDKLIDGGLLGRGGAIGFISSAAGLGWEQNLTRLNEYLDITDWDAAVQWALDNGKADYMWSKLSVCAYVARQAFPLIKQGIRINAILPSPTDTPLARANADTWLTFAQDYRDATGTQPSTALEQAYPLLFLCSDAASGISGVTLVTDAGYFASGVSNTFGPASDAVGFFRMEF